jgi:hypothetical protein
MTKCRFFTKKHKPSHLSLPNIFQNIDHMQSKIIILLAFISIPMGLFAQNDTIVSLQEIPIHRDYSYIFSPNYDIHNTSINTRTTGKLLNDAFNRGLGPKIKNTTVRNITGGVWSFFTTFSAMIWSHEFGHMLRARQVGGKFSIEKYAFPVIHGKMELPPNTSLTNNSLTIIGGFEANYLTVKDIQLDFYKYGSLYNDELSLSFAHRLMYPIYFSLIAPVDPAEPQTWINTMGDPVHFIKPVWINGGQEIFIDGNVNPALVRFYKQAALMSLFWNLADPNFYREISATFSEDTEGKHAKYIIGNSQNGWSWGTLFNTSIFGAELYLTNYFRINNKLYTLYLRHGFPFQNDGLGVSAVNFYKNKKFNSDINLDIWNQQSYNLGFAATTHLRYNFSNQCSIVTQIGWKTDGYLMGRPLDKGFIGYAGLNFKLNHNQ